MVDLKRQHLLLAIISMLYSVIVIGGRWELFSQTRTREDYEFRYSQSQYVMGEAKEIILGDGDIYTYAGIRYIEGEDVTKINFEHPPFIKYLFGLSYHLFGLPNWAILPFIPLAIYSFWLLAAYLIKPVWGKWLAMGLFLGHSAIYQNLPQTMLDFPSASLLLAVLAMHLSILKKPSYTRSILFGITAGLTMLAKYPFPLTALLLGMLWLYQWYRRVPVLVPAVSMLSMVLTYLIGYTSYFMAGHSFMDWLKFEWWRWQWFGGKLDSPRGMIWQTIFFGRYPKWWENSGEYITVGHWSILWPGLVILYAASWLKKFWVKADDLFPYKLWIIAALAAFTLGVAEDRYLLPLIPGFALYAASLLVSLITDRKRYFLRPDRRRVGGQ